MNYRWRFDAEDENGDRHYLTAEEFIGSYSEACFAVAILADERERSTGALIVRLVLERRGEETSEVQAAD